jgi:uncharacterized protein
MRSRFLRCALVSTAGLAVFACRSEPSSREPKAEHAAPTPQPHIVPLAVLGDRLAICREEKDKPLPSWTRAAAGGFISVTRTRDELSIIVSDQRPPAQAKCERDWRLIMVKGPLDFTQVGIIAGLSGTLASAGISIFALSTYDTDYIMVKQADLERALSALRQAGYPVSQLASS